MKKSKNKSQTSVLSSKSEIREPTEESLPTLDVLTLKIYSLRLYDEEPKVFHIRATFFDQLIINSQIKAIGRWDKAANTAVLMGTMAYDPSDYEKMCLFSDRPLSVSIQPLTLIEASGYSSQSGFNKSSSKSNSTSTPQCFDDVSCCNIDILPLILGRPKMQVKTRMHTLMQRSVLQEKSWGNLPQIKMELQVTRDIANEIHHRILENINYLTLTLVGAYNMPIPFDAESVYTAASILPVQNEMHNSMYIFNSGRKKFFAFDDLNFYRKWESLRLGDNVFTKADMKFLCKVEDIRNDSNIDLPYYLKQSPSCNTTVWASFHRTLLFESSEKWFKHQLRNYKWPFELHIYSENQGMSFMAFLDLFRLLYPGETSIVLAVPLDWINAQEMLAHCNYENLLTPNENKSSTQKMKPPETAGSGSTPSPITSLYGPYIMPPTGADGNTAFIIVELKLARPLVEIAIPTCISNNDLTEMLNYMEEQGPEKRECTGRGQLDRDWHSTIRNAVTSLRSVPYHGSTDLCSFNRQLSETRTRVEITTSCWLDAAIYVNNNFVLQNFLQSDKTFEELLMMAHACLMQNACETLLGYDDRSQINPIIKAARHAKQMQDIHHAINLYLQYIAGHHRCANSWRELATCLLNVDRDWANVCIDKSLSINPRHALTLLSKACMIFEENPAEAEPFFNTILALYPYWLLGWTIVSAYYIHREYFYMADKILDIVKETAPDIQFTYRDISQPRTWEYELGDWWDYTPILPGQNRFYDAADLLLRMRAIPLAEICVSRALIGSGETAAYFHLVALCCRLRGDVDNALCFLETALEKYGEISYLRSLEGECYHKNKDTESALRSLEKANCVGAYCTLLSIPCHEPNRRRSLLVDLVRRQPCAYTWMALADDWIAKASMGEGGDGGFTELQDQAKVCAIACAVQALKWDRKAGRAWDLLSKLVKPSARRLYCKNMALACGYDVTSSDEKIETASMSKQSLCYHLGTSLRECRCDVDV